MVLIQVPGVAYPKPSLPFQAPEETILGPRVAFQVPESPFRSRGVDRIQVLAELRNQALRPVLNATHEYSAEITVVFLNDVSLCMEDVLELIHQRRFHSGLNTPAEKPGLVGRPGWPVWRTPRPNVV